MSDDAVPAPAIDGELLPAPKARPSGLRPFVKGDPRINRNGRVKYSKNLIHDAFVKDLIKWHAKYGIKAIEQVGREQPAELLRIIANLVPKKVDVEHEHTGTVTFRPLSVQEIERKAQDLLARLLHDGSEGSSAE